MIYIKKGKEPDSLTKYKKQKFAYYDGYKEKDDVREMLLKEQGYLYASVSYTHLTLPTNSRV